MRILKSQFEQAIADSKKLPERPGYKTLLRIYMLYKQATEGDITGKRPVRRRPGLGQLKPREQAYPSECSHI